MNSQSALLDAEDGATVVTDTIKDDQDDKEPKSCPQQTVKVDFMIRCFGRNVVVGNQKFGRRVSFNPKMS